MQKSKKNLVDRGLCIEKLHCLCVFYLQMQIVANIDIKADGSQQCWLHTHSPNLILSILFQDWNIAENGKKFWFLVTRLTRLLDVCGRPKCLLQNVGYFVSVFVCEVCPAYTPFKLCRFILLASTEALVTSDRSWRSCSHSWLMLLMLFDSDWC